MSDADELLTIKELADWLKVEIRSVYDMNTRGTGPARIMVGGKVRYRRGDVRDWLAARRIEARVPA